MATLAPRLSKPREEVIDLLKEGTHHRLYADLRLASMSEDSSPAGSGGTLALQEFLEEPSASAPASISSTLGRPPNHCRLPCQTLEKFPAEEKMSDQS